jgi:hypothetical protein
MNVFQQEMLNIYNGQSPSNRSKKRNLSNSNFEIVLLLLIGITYIEGRTLYKLLKKKYSK